MNPTHVDNGEEKQRWNRDEVLTNAGVSGSYKRV